MLAIGKYDVITGRTGDRVPNLTATDRAMNIKPDDAQKFHRQTAEIQVFQASLYGRYPFTSTGGIVVKGGFGYALETQGRPGVRPGPPAGRRPERRSARARAGPPVVR